MRSARGRRRAAPGSRAFPSREVAAGQHRLARFVRHERDVVGTDHRAQPWCRARDARRDRRPRSRSRCPRRSPPPAGNPRRPRTRRRTAWPGDGRCLRRPRAVPAARVQHADLVGEGEGFLLVVGHEDRRRVGGRRIFSTSSRICARRSASRFENGSSRSNSAGSGASARASATRCCWPPDSSWG